MFKNWNTNDADLADFHGFWKILFKQNFPYFDNNQ